MIIEAKLGNNVLRIKNCEGLSSVKGLMFDSLELYDGALIYGNAIWMPFVKCSLNLFFLDDAFRIVQIKTAIPLTLNPNTWLVYKNEGARYCMEVKAGVIKNLKTLVGKRVVIG